MAAQKKGDNSATRFKAGQSGNPGGRPPLPEHIRKTKALTAAEFIQTVAKYYGQPEYVLEAALDDRELPQIDRIIVKFLHNSGKSGNYAELERLLSRLIGPVKQTHEVNFKRRTIINRPSGEQVIMESERDEEE